MSKNQLGVLMLIGGIIGLGIQSYQASANGTSAINFYTIIAMINMGIGIALLGTKHKIDK
jgi:hypothetical protein